MWDSGLADVDWRKRFPALPKLMAPAQGVNLRMCILGDYREYDPVVML
jgi:hypothetical protein